MMVNALTIDLEDWYQAIPTIPFEQWGSYEEIHQQGHEVALHGYSHALIYHQTPKEFKDDLSRAIRQIKSITGERPLGYRAPWFSITHISLWALEILMEEGFLYDSSIIPTKNFAYGIPSARSYPYRIKSKSGRDLLEFPPSTLNLLGINIPVCGGFYLRLFPYGLVRRAIQKLNRERQPAMIYFHPWELDPDQPHLRLSPTQYLIHYLNLNHAGEKLGALLRDFHFEPVREILHKVNFE